MASSRKSRGTRIEEENLGGLPVIRLMSMTKNDNLRPEDTPSAVEGRRKMMYPHSETSQLPQTAVTGATVRSSSRIMGWTISPAWRITSTPRNSRNILG